MSTHLSRAYDLNYPCTWTLVQTCSCQVLIQLRCFTWDFVALHLSLLGLVFFYLFIIIIYVIYLCGVPNKVVQKKKSKVKTTEVVLRFVNVQLVVKMVLAQSTSNIVINMWVERFPLEWRLTYFGIKTFCDWLKKFRATFLSNPK